MIQALGDEIELLWLTGELKLEKPTVAQEVAWGLYFFDENLFDVVPQMLAKAESAFAKHFPGETLEVPQLFNSVPGSAGIATVTPTSPAK